MLFKKIFLVYLPKLDKYYVVKAKDEASAAVKVINAFKPKFDAIQGYTFIKNMRVIK